MRFYLLIAATFLLSFATAQAAEQTVKLAGLEVTVWSKETEKAVKQPVIIFSHGFHECATQSPEASGLRRKWTLGVREKVGRRKISLAAERQRREENLIESRGTGAAFGGH